MPDLVGYWAVNSILAEDLAYKEAQMDDLRAKLEDSTGFNKLSESEQKDIEFKYNLNRRDSNDIMTILPQSEHAYNFAKHEAKWNGHMLKQNITAVDDRRAFLRKVM